MARKALIGALLLLACPCMASAQSVDDALAHYRAGRIEEALAAFEQVRQSATDDPAALVTTHVYLGVIHAAMGDEPLARRDFAVALALDPSLSPPSELGPAQQRIFEDVRQSTRALTVSVEAPDAPVAGEPVALRASAQNVPAHIVAALRVRATPEDGEAWVTRVEGTEAAVTVPASAWSGGTRLSLLVEALTTHGGVLARGQQPLVARLPDVVAAAAVDTADPAVATTDEGGGSVAEEAWFWILIGALVAGGVAAAILIPTVGTQDVYDLGAPTIVRM
ncbi:MAG: hypothetical protein H6719_29040 [Sandaracinaceae bacterium]|nr:hypothetical protein [Sandaracinaceae bacterium]